VAAPTAAATAVLAELGAGPGPGAAASALARPAAGPRRQLAPLTAFGVTIADIMLHDRHHDPDPVIAAWLAGNTASRRNTTSPADVLAHWDQASPALQAALARPLAARLDTFYQLRYRAVAGPACIPHPAHAQERAAAACTNGPARCSPTPQSTSPSPGNRRSPGPPASPGPAPTPTASAPKTCTRSSAPGCPSAPSPPGSRPPPTTSGWQRPATRHPSLRPAAPHRPRPSRTCQAMTSFATSPARDTAHARSPASPDAASAIRQHLTSAGLHQPAPPDGKEDIDPHWLREHYQHRQRSLKDIAAETGAPVEDLAAAARKADIRVRHGINARAHPLAALGGPGAFPTAVWSVSAHPGAEQRIRRLLALPGQPGLSHAARQLGVRNAILASQVRQLETTIGTALLHTGPDGRLTLTAYGQLFACDVRPALESLAQSREGKAANHGKLPRTPPGIVHLPGQPDRRELFNYSETPSSWCSTSRDPYRFCRDRIYLNNRPAT
jgi:hypothetical protein